MGKKIVFSTKRAMSVVLCIALIFTTFLTQPLRVKAAEREIPENLNCTIVSTDGNSEETAGSDETTSKSQVLNQGNVRCLSVTYDHDRYLSLRDLATLLSGSEKQFDVSVDNKGIAVVTGIPYGARGGENEPFTEEDLNCEHTYGITLKQTDFTWDEAIQKRYTLCMNNAQDIRDCFIQITDLALCLNADISVEGKELTIDVSKPFTMTPQTLEENRFFEAINSILVGDATTGEIYYDYLGDDAVAIASTTKLMTYAVVNDALKNGEISMQDEVTISENASRVSYEEDGVIRLTAGQTTTMDDLLKAMMLASSNESAVVLAEHTAGSEEAFVKRMNEKARQIGMSEKTEFFNPHGLPVYTDSTIAAKHHNMSTAKDMFVLVMYLLKEKPEILDYSKLKEADVPTLGLTVKNTNPMLYNLDGCVGLKTGTTNRAGCCLITAVKQDVNGEPHMIVTAEFGSESYVIRGLSTELLMRYGRETAVNGGVGGEVMEAKEESDEISCEQLLRRLLAGFK